MDLIILCAILTAIILRIWIQNGYILLPQIKREGNKVYFQLNILGTILTSLITVLMLQQAQPELFNSFIGALISTYTIPHLLDNIVSKGLTDEESDYGE